jgi:hypothetical protein
MHPSNLRPRASKGSENVTASCITAARARTAPPEKSLREPGCGRIVARLTLAGESRGQSYEAKKSANRKDRKNRNQDCGARSRSQIGVRKDQVRCSQDRPAQKGSGQAQVRPKSIRGKAHQATARGGHAAQSGSRGRTRRHRAGGHPNPAALARAQEDGQKEGRIRPKARAAETLRAGAA